MASSSHQQKCSCHDCIEPKKTPFINPKFLFSHLPLDNDSTNPYKHLIFANPPINPLHSLSLQGLPKEIYGEILSYLTIQEVTDLRRTSQYTRSSIDRILQYQEIYTYAPSALRACLATCTASRITLRQLYHTLTNPECYLCSASLATNLHLFTGHRVCVFCLRNDITLQPLEVRLLLKQAMNPRSESRHLLPLQNTLKAIPGNYTLPGQVVPMSQQRRKALYLESDLDPSQLSLLSETERKVLFGNPYSYDAEVRREVKHNPFIQLHTESKINPNDPNSNGMFLAPMTSVAQSLATELLYMTSIYIPFLHPKTKLLEQGMLCEECILHMRFVEREWKMEQRRRRLMGRRGTATDRRRAVVNEARKASCRFYTEGGLVVHKDGWHEEKVSAPEREYWEALRGAAKDDVENGGDGDLGIVGANL